MLSFIHTHAILIKYQQKFQLFKLEIMNKYFIIIKVKLIKYIRRAFELIKHIQ